MAERSAGKGRRLGWAANISSLTRNFIRGEPDTWKEGLPKHYLLQV